MLTAEGEVKILDFGIYKRLQPEDGVPMTTTISKDGRLVGTVTAMSPEQAAGAVVDQRSDLFSLGSLLYELLTGTPPFVGENSHETLSRICLYKETPVHEVNAEVPEVFSQLIGALLEKDPIRRPQSAAEVDQALAEIATGAPVLGLVSGRWAGTTTASTAMGQATVLTGTQAQLSQGPTIPARPGETGVPTPTAGLWTTGISGIAPGETSSGPVVRTLLLNDLVDSTKLVEALGDERAAQIFEQHDRVARDLLQKNSGREIDKSDGFLMLFERPMDAVRFALGYHAALAEISEQEGVTVASRVGIHVGEVVLRVNTIDDVSRGAKALEVEGLAKSARGNGDVEQRQPGGDPRHDPGATPSSPGGEHDREVQQPVADEYDHPTEDQDPDKDPELLDIMDDLVPRQFNPLGKHPVEAVGQAFKSLDQA